MTGYAIDRSGRYWKTDFFSCWEYVQEADGRYSIKASTHHPDHETGVYALFEPMQWQASLYCTTLPAQLGFSVVDVSIDGENGEFFHQLVPIIAWGLMAADVIKPLTSYDIGWKNLDHPILHPNGQVVTSNHVWPSLQEFLEGRELELRAHANGARRRPSSGA